MAAKGNSRATRVVHDSFGELRVPAQALYGATTQRAVENFPISGLPMPGAFLRALGLVKAAAAEANAELGLLQGDRVLSIDRPTDTQVTFWRDHVLLELRSDWTVNGATHRRGSLLMARASDYLAGRRYPLDLLVHYDG